MWALFFRQVPLAFSDGRGSAARPAEIILKFAEPLRMGKPGAQQAALLASLEQRYGGIEIGRIVPQQLAAKLAQIGGADPTASVVLVRLHRDFSDALLDSLSQLPEVAYASRNHVFRVAELPDDPLVNEQWGLQAVGAFAAWQKTRGSPALPIVLIDTGVESDHEDLRGQIWVNPGEDLNGNGRADRSDYNGVDDDANGFVDDLIGWDFVDAPTYPDAGDYQGRDNDPADEHGHGTAMAGIMAARADNGLGIAGVAPGTKIVNLRAGTAQGLLEEDDVAAAILYAVAMKFRVINMSFGDVIITPFLRDVIRYAHANGMILVASSGNSGDAQMHYPSGLSETISVGASTEGGYRAGFSSYGSSLDLVAPGLRIYTTTLGNQYTEVSGTSAATPFVSATVALLLALQPEMPAEVVRDRLLQACEDLNEPGWNFETGAGLLRADQAVQDVGPQEVQILSPRQNSATAEEAVPVVGTCAGALIEGFELSVGVGENPSNWETLLASTDRQVIAETLLTWQAPAEKDTCFTFRLRGFLRNGRYTDDYTTLFVDHSPPVISDFELLPIIWGEQSGYLYALNTDDLTRAILFYRPLNSGAEFLRQTFQLENTRHANLLLDDGSGGMEFYLEVKNRAGLMTRFPPDSNLTAIFPESGALRADLNPVLTEIPSGYFLNRALDFDGDGRAEVALNRYQNGHRFGQLAYFEYTGDKFKLVRDTGYMLLPRDVADVNGDGKPEMLAGAGKASVILTASYTPYPDAIVWLDTSDVWASRLFDFNGDGYPEMLAKSGNEWKLWQNQRDYSFAPLADLPNRTEGINGTGVPHAEIGDFDSDATSEVLLGDYDGDIYLYEIGADLQPRWEWSDRMPLGDAIDFLASGDFDGDGVPEFAAGSHSPNDLDLEHQFDERHWLVRIYDFDAGTYQVVFEQRFYGFFSPRDFDSGMGTGDLNGDGRDDLLLMFYPHGYVISYDPVRAEYRVLAHTQPVRSSRMVLYDFDGDGRREWLVNQEDGATLFRLSDALIAGSVRPKLRAVARDSQSVRLTWQADMPDSGFVVYRGANRDSLIAIAAEVRAHSFVDSNLTDGVVYWYQVAAVDSAAHYFSRPVSAVPHNPASWKILRILPPNQLLLRFSLPMGNSVTEIFNYRLLRAGLEPVSAVLSGDLRDVLLSWPAGFHFLAQDTLQLSGVADSSGTLLRANNLRAGFAVNTTMQKQPYILRATFRDARRLEVEFSEPMDAELLLQSGNYRVEPDMKVLSVNLADDSDRRVWLELEPGRPVGPIGSQYDLYVRGLKSASGVPLNPEIGYRVTFLFVAENLRDVYTYPNPAVAQVTFARLTPEATIEIYNLSGIRVQTLNVQTRDGGFVWNLTDANGKPLPSGIYIFRVFNDEESHWGKFAVVR